MHRDELWQEYGFNGEPLENGGYPARLDNPAIGSGKILGVSKIWVFRRTDDEPELLWQKRSPKIENGGLWDVSAGGHINYGETPLMAAARECDEEIGLKIVPEKLFFGFVTHKTTRIFWQYFYDCTGQNPEFHFNDSEVTEIQWVPLSKTDEFRRHLAKGGLAEDDTYFDLVKSWLDKFPELKK